eukprot:scaffold297115_cov26-Tisochrysis_lutea.AAC.2
MGTAPVDRSPPYAHAAHKVPEVFECRHGHRQLSRTFVTVRMQCMAVVRCATRQCALNQTSARALQAQPSKTPVYETKTVRGILQS